MYRFLDFDESSLIHVVRHTPSVGRIARGVFEVVHATTDFHRVERDICTKSYVVTRQDRIPDMWIEAEELLVPKMSLASKPGQLGLNEDVIALRLLSNATPMEHYVRSHDERTNWGIRENLTVARHLLLEHELDVANVVCHSNSAYELTDILSDMWPNVKVLHSRLGQVGHVYLTAAPEHVGVVVDYDEIHFDEKGNEVEGVGFALINDYACSMLYFGME